MSSKGGDFKTADIKQLDPNIAAQYATKTPKTITRDMNRLKKLGLVDVGPAGYRAKIDVMLAFLPMSINNRPAPRKSESEPRHDRQLELGLTLPTG
jgi:hypothetical protein